MNLQDAFSSPRVMRLGMFLSRYSPPAIGHSFAKLAASSVCRAKPAVYRIVEANLRQVLGVDAPAAVLRRTTRQVFYFAVRSYYDLYHALAQPRFELAGTVDFPESAQATVRDIRQAGSGTVLAVLHLGNFDLAGQALAAHLPGLQVLSLPDPTLGFQLANNLRRLGGLTVTPLSTGALRQAIEHLLKQGVVGMGGDRPVSGLDKPVPFFGRPARAPSGPVRLALRTGARIVVAYCVVHPATQRDTLYLEPPLELVRTGNRDEDVTINMRRLLDVLEPVIRRWLGQWLMFVPVWPE